VWARFRSFVAAAQLRQAEEDLARHQAKGHRLRAFVLERRVETMRRGQTGERVVTYLQLGVRAR
jgi:hypothetical protein